MNSLTAGNPGPVLIQDTHLLEKLGHFDRERIQLRQTALFYKADPDYGSRVAQGLGLDVKEIEQLANMSHEERAQATAQ